MADGQKARRQRRDSYASAPAARVSRSDEQSAPAHLGTRRSSMTASWHSRRSDAGESMPGPDGARRTIAPTRFRLTSTSSSVGDAPASPFHVPARPPVAFGAPAFDPGTKYIQRMGPLTPVESVVPLPHTTTQDTSSGSRSGRHRRRSHEHRAGALKGARMEDSAVVVPRLGVAAGVSLAMVADGHGSVPMVSRRLDSRDTSEPTVFVGGPECAALAAASASRYLARVAGTVDMGRLTREGIACVLRDAFLFAQRMCAEETARGCLVQGEDDDTRQHRDDRSTASSLSRSASDHAGRSRARRGSSSAARRVGGRLDRSAIDGAYFAKVHGPAGASLAERGDPRALVVVDKVRVPYRPLGANGAPGPKGHLVYYVEANGQRTLAEYGTTLTAVLITPLLPSDVRRGRASKGWLGRVFVAHAGDSDVFLFHRDPQAHRACYTPSRLTDDHTLSNRDEVARLAPYGVGVHPPYFVVTTGPECGQMLMPSRSLGHVLMSQHRITAVPSISTALVGPGDIVVAASDGLWASYGLAGGWHPPQRARDAPAPTGEALSAMRVATVLDGLSDGIASGSISPADVARVLRDDLVRHVVRKRDNAAIVVGICQPPPSSIHGAGAPHGRQVLSPGSRHR